MWFWGQMKSNLLKLHFPQTCCKTPQHHNKFNYDSNSSTLQKWRKQVSTTSHSEPLFGRDSIVLKSACLSVSEWLRVSERVFQGQRRDVLFKCESPIIHHICRGEGEHQRQQLSLFRSVVQCFLTHCSNWRPSCWQQRSTSWQHQASGGVGQQVGQQDMMSDESRAELCQGSRGEKQDMTSDDYEQGRVRGWNHTGRKRMETKRTGGRTGDDCRAGGSERGRGGGGGTKEAVWRALVDSLRSRGPQERNHIYKAETAVEILNGK